MYVVLSPSKKLEEKPSIRGECTIPELIDQSDVLIKNLKTKSVSDIASLMGLSDALAQLNADRYQAYSTPFNQDNASQALWTFKGDVYDGLDADSLSDKDAKFAQQHVRILSGLYGLLRPFDLMQPYRLEMGCRFSGSWGKNLYDFWGDQLSCKLKEQMAKDKEDVLINLASNEYFKAIKPKTLNMKVITIGFKEYKNGGYKSLMLYVKRARGMMARYIITHKLKCPENLKDFSEDGYKFEASMSDDDNYMFVRKAQ